MFDIFTGLGYRESQAKIYDAGSTCLPTTSHGGPLKLSSNLNLGWAF